MTLLRRFLLLLLGLASLLPYLGALGLSDLRAEKFGYLVAYLSAFALYLAACALVLNRADTGSAKARFFPLSTFSLIVPFALLFRLLLLPTPPTLSDDMFRYVWDGRVQGHGVSPYRYPPNARELRELRPFGSPAQRDVYRHINRKAFVTVYPAGAQLAFAGMWRLLGDSVPGFKVVFVLAELLGAGLLLQLLRHFEQPPERVLIYLWSPLLVFEVAQAGHVDGLMLPLLIAAFWARVKERPVLLGVCLGAAALIKLFPALLLPALLPLPAQFSWRGLRPALKMLVAFALTFIAAYLPYVLWGGEVLGFLPNYFTENFNLGLARLLFGWADAWGVPRATAANAVTFGGLAVLGAVFMLKPAAGGRAALARCVWLIGWFTLFTQNLFPWYLLWLLPLLTVLVEPGRLFGFRLAPATAWLAFTGTVVFAYLFFIEWRVIDWAQAAAYLPLYGLLVASTLRLNSKVRPANERHTTHYAREEAT